MTKKKNKRKNKRAVLPIGDAAFLLLVEKRKMWYGISEVIARRVQSLPVKGVMFMVTYAELFQYSLVIIGIINLMLLLRNDKKKTA